MAGIKDSGERRQFATGAVRDITTGKGRCDLLPLDIIGTELNCTAFHAISEYVYHGNPKTLWTAIELFIQYLERERGVQDLNKIKTILEVSKHFEEGALKYGERNWEQGIPVHCYIDSGVRHLLKAIDRWDDEPHENAFVWNMVCAIWTHEHFSELRDLPFDRRDTRDAAVDREIGRTVGLARGSAPINGVTKQN